MELWFVYAVISIFTSGIIGFISKVAADRGEQVEVVSSIAFVTITTGSLLLWLGTGMSLEGLGRVWPLLVVGGILYAIQYSLRIQALTYIEATMFFPIYKTVAPIMMLAAGVLYFKDNLAGLDYVGIVLGATVPLMLIQKSENQRQKSLLQGITVLMIGAVLAVFTSSIAKITVGTIENIWLVIGVSSVMSLVFLLSKYGYQSHQKGEGMLRGCNTTVLALGLAAGVVETVGSFFLLTALAQGPLSVVYTVNSFYILIPIILSVWLYGEHMNTRKALAIGLSIVAVIFFQIEIT